MSAPPRAAASPPGTTGHIGNGAPTMDEDDIRALIALAALGGPERLAHEERVALGRALDASPALRAELRALAAVAVALPAPEPVEEDPTAWARAIPEPLLRPPVLAVVAGVLLLLALLRVLTS